MIKLDTKNIFWILVNIILVVGIIFLVLGLKTALRFMASLPPARTITVSAEGKTVVSPDIASVNFSVVTEGADPAVLSKENTDKLNKAIAFLKEQEIDSQDIKTAGYNLYPKYEYDEKRGTSSIIGYTLNQTVYIKIRKFEKIGLILGALPKYGVNEISSLNFDIEDPDQYLNTARQEAFAKAYEKAKTMAEQNGAKIKRVVTFSENSGGYPWPIFYAAAEKGGYGGGGAPTPLPTIEPGSQEVSIQVTVTYEIK